MDKTLYTVRFLVDGESTPSEFFEELKDVLRSGWDIEYLDIYEDGYCHGVTNFILKAKKS